jgi:hypothetical protein
MQITITAQKIRLRSQGSKGGLSLPVQAKFKK